MDLFTLGNITISRDWLTPIGVALVLLSFYWLRNKLPLILKSASFAVLALWLVSIGYLTSECYGSGYEGTLWEWQYIGVDHWKAFTNIESCMSESVYEVGGKTAVRVWWNMPLLVILLWWLGSMFTRRRVWRRKFKKSAYKTSDYCANRHGEVKGHHDPVGSHEVHCPGRGDGYYD